MIQESLESQDPLESQVFLYVSDWHFLRGGTAASFSYRNMSKSEWQHKMRLTSWRRVAVPSQGEIGVPGERGIPGPRGVAVSQYLHCKQSHSVHFNLNSIQTHIEFMPLTTQTLKWDALTSKDIKTFIPRGFLALPRTPGPESHKGIFLKNWIFFHKGHSLKTHI